MKGNQNKRVYAKQLDGECFRFEEHYDEEMASEELFAAYNSADRYGINESLILDTFKALENCDYDIGALNHDLSEEDRLAEIRETVKYYFKPAGKAVYDDCKMDRLAALAEEFVSRASTERDYEIAKEALSIQYGEPFKYGWIKGSSQGDWMRYICPESISKERVHWIEAVLFATGTEFMVCTDENQEEEPDWDECGMFVMYTDKWRDEDVKEDIKNILGSDLAEDGEVKLVMITDVRTVKQYSYEIR